MCHAGPESGDGESSEESATFEVLDVPETFVEGVSRKVVMAIV
jgi:hypothetical protein